MGNTQFLDSKLMQDETYGLVSKFTYNDTLVIQKNLDISQNKTELIQMTQLHQSLVHKNLIKIHKYELEAETIQIYMEYFENTLAKDIIQRKLKNNYYQEHELLSLLEQLIQVGAYLQENSIYHDDIRPQNIFLLSNGTIKLTHAWLLENQLQRYYAPEQYESNQLNHYKLGVFSLGMTMLHLMTLTQMDLCYLKKSINLSLINEILNSTLYSSKLINKVTVLLAGSNNRPDFITAQNQIPKLSNKLFQVSPRQSNNQRFICRQVVKSPISPHSHSPFTFRGAIVQPSLVQVQQPQQIQQFTQQPTQILQIPQLLPKIQSQPLPQLQQQQQQQQLQQQQQQQQQQEKIFKHSPNRQSTRSSEPSPVTPVKTNLDQRIQRAIQLTNETLKKNSMIQ